MIPRNLPCKEGLCNCLTYCFLMSKRQTNVLTVLLLFVIRVIISLPSPGTFSRPFSCVYDNKPILSIVATISPRLRCCTCVKPARMLRCNENAHFLASAYQPFSPCTLLPRARHFPDLSTPAQPKQKTGESANTKQEDKSICIVFFVKELSHTSQRTLESRIREIIGCERKSYVHIQLHALFSTTHPSLTAQFLHKRLLMHTTLLLAVTDER